MIRVTTKEGRVFECLYIRKYNELYMASRDMYSDTYEWRSDIDDIVKIEKQVKDLTLDECSKINIDYDGIFGWVYIKTNNGVKKTSMNDYVDVTDIYKRGDC